MKKKKKTKNQTIKDLHLDKETSHGGWPTGHAGSWINKKPVNLQIADYLKSMGLIERPSHARLSEEKLRLIIRKVIIESYNYC